MSWGTYWMFYACPDCGSRFRWDMCTVTNPDFGRCPNCGVEGVLVGESSAPPEHPNDYPDCSE